LDARPTAVERILEAAKTCIGRDGLDGSTMQSIAKGAGVSKALVHYHFQTKDQLFLEVQARAFRIVAQRVAEVAGSMPPSVEQTLVALDHVWELLLGFRDQVPFTLELWSQATRRPELRERVEEFQAEMIGLIEQGLSTTLGHYVDALPFSIGRTARLLHVVLFGVATQSYFAQSEDIADQTYQDLRLVLGRALVPKEAKI
jgi:AcrR family transcriptional regulator